MVPDLTMGRGSFKGTVRAIAKREISEGLVKAWAALNGWADLNNRIYVLRRASAQGDAFWRALRLLPIPHLAGKPPPPKNPFGSGIDILKPNSLNIDTCVLSKLLRQFHFNEICTVINTTKHSSYRWSKHAPNKSKCGRRHFEKKH